MNTTDPPRGWSPASGTTPALTALLLAILAAGCAPQAEVSGESRETAAMNAWSVESYTDDMIHQAIIRQRTLYPYHFVEDSSQLNELGTRDLDVLMGHFRTQQAPVRLNVPADGRDEALHRARVDGVRELLAANGFDVRQETVADEAPGGQGMQTGQYLLVVRGSTRHAFYPSGRGQRVTQPAPRSQP